MRRVDNVERPSTVLFTATRRRRQVAAVSASVSPGTDRAPTSWRASVGVWTSRAGSTPTVRRCRGRRSPVSRVWGTAAAASPAASPSRVAPVAFDVPTTPARSLITERNISQYFLPTDSAACRKHRVFIYRGSVIPRRPWLRQRCYIATRYLYKISGYAIALSARISCSA